MSLLPKSFSNQDIANLLQNIAIAYVIKDENRFRITSYQNAADNIVTYPESVYEIWKKDPKDLDNIPGVGEAIIEKLSYLFTKNQLHPHIKEAFANINPVVFTFTKINGVGPKIAYKLTQQLKFSSDPTKALDQLVIYCRKHRIRSLETFGEKSENLILENTQNFLGQKRRMDYSQARAIADDVIHYLHQQFPHTEFVALGSLRRQSPSVGDIDIAAKSEQTQDILNYFLQYPQAVQTINHGHKKASLRLLHDIRIDLMVQPAASWGSLLVHFTGSRQHNILLRRYALSLGYSISEYGITEVTSKKLYRFDNEIDFYKFLKLKYIDPINRLGEKEIEEAKMLQ